MSIAAVSFGQPAPGVASVNDISGNGSPEVTVLIMTDDGCSAGAQMRNVESKAQVNHAGFRSEDSVYRSMLRCLRDDARYQSPEMTNHEDSENDFQDSLPHASSLAASDFAVSPEP